MAITILGQHIGSIRPEKIHRPVVGAAWKPRSKVRARKAHHIAVATIIEAGVSLTQSWERPKVWEV